MELSLKVTVSSQLFEIIKVIGKRSFTLKPACRLPAGKAGQGREQFK